MPKMIVSIDGAVIKELQLTRERTTLGRRPYNDLVIDNLAVSGEHAVFILEGDDVVLEDLNSTNGTYVNGKAVKTHKLDNGDVIEIGKYKIRYVGAQHDPGFDKTMVMTPAMRASLAAGGAAAATTASTAAPTPATGATPSPAPPPPAGGAIEVLSGPASGRQVPLTKVVTTLGKPGIAVAAITQRGLGHTLSLVEGNTAPMLNGEPVGSTPVALKDGDVIDLAGTRMRFHQH